VHARSYPDKGERWWLTPSRISLLALLLLVSVTAAFSLAASATAADPVDKIEPGVLADAANGQATYWAILGEEADLSKAPGIQNRTARGTYVVEQLKEVAEESQAGLLALLTKQGVQHQSFWIMNAIKITSGQAVLLQVAAQPEVAKILADRVYQIPHPIAGKTEPKINTVEWGIDRIRADDVWATFNNRGEGIVVANIDTGVQFDHSALVRQYRGNLGGGNFDHNYSWFDPSNVCGSPSLVPCDNNGHGTHTMGTMVGDDGDPGANQIGVAPHARWIAAKGCETNSCSSSALLASGQWILAPTDLNGQNPRPDLRPHVVNNSWSGGGGDPWYQATVDAWIASGIYPQFANGNAGPACNTSGSPGDYVQSYSAGAFDINNAIAGFSSRGASAFGGELKPNIAAPGVNVRSSVPNNSYASFNGTSMASPHVAGTVALMWSAAPVLNGDIPSTRTILDDTAIDVTDPQCGGTTDDNNVWGEGRLDAFAAVDASPTQPTGTLQGVVTNVNNGNPIAGATVEAVGPVTRMTTTDAAGNYSLTLVIGTYNVTASAFGFAAQTANNVVITDGGTTTQNFALSPAPSHTVSGHVRDTNGLPIANATVEILDTPIPPETTDANGFYSFASVPEGSYTARAEAGGCNTPQEQALVVDGNETLDFVLPQLSDSFGYFCVIQTPNYLEAANVLPLTGDDSSTQVALPFPFTFYGQTHNTAFVTTNGNLNFLALNSSFSNTSIPNTGAPNGAIYPFWDDMFVDASASVRTELLGVAPNRQFVIEWRNVHFFGDSSRRVDFEVVLRENGQILTQYRNIASDGREQGNSATLGIENQTGTIGLQFSFNQPSIESPEFAVLYRLPPSGFVEGIVSDANDNLPLAGATVRALQNGNLVRQTTTDANGFYRMQLVLGTYTVEASATNYGAVSAQVVLSQDGQVVMRNFALPTARGVVNPTSLQFIVPPNQTRTKMLTLRNTGGLPMTWEIRETGGGAAGASTTAGLQKDPAANPNASNTEGLYVGGTPAGWAPSAPGDVIRTWTTNALQLAWGVGYTGNVWLSDVDAGGCGPTCQNWEYTPLGAQTGVHWATPWAGAWPGDMSPGPSGSVCQVNVGGDNGIYCWNPNTGATTGSITGNFPWTSISQRGLAYRPDDDTYYIGGWNQGVLYHVKGLSYPDKGAVISSCNPPDGNISGLTWNPAFGIVWAATNSPTDTIYELNPNTCAVLATLPHPNPGFNGAGLEMDEVGNLWMVSQNAHNAYLVESGVPSFVDVPWLSESPTSGTLAPGGTQLIQVSVNTTGLAPGVYSATLFIQTNSGRMPTLTVPVRLIVPRYFQGVNAGDGVYTDVAGDLWSADKQYTPGSYGYMNSSAPRQDTNRPIAGTVDDPLYQDLRQNPSEYRFDGLPNGVYQVDLRFAEVRNRNPGSRLFDVTVEGALVLPAHDIAAEVGDFAADDHVFFVAVTDGQLNVRLIERRGYAPPIINGIRAIHRPDM
jgi:subtilisin family serine protease